MPKDVRLRRRSGCPVSVSLDIFGDKWSLLIIRDLMTRGYRTFGEFLSAGEGIATNVLAARLRNLTSAGLIHAETVTQDRRSIAYRLTSKGIALAPVLLELLIWSGQHEQTGASKSFVAHLNANRAMILAEAYRRWEQRDLTPLIPRFKAAPTS